MTCSFGPCSPSPIVSEPRLSYALQETRLWGARPPQVSSPGFVYPASVHHDLPWHDLPSRSSSLFGENIHGTEHSVGESQVDLSDQVGVSRGIKVGSGSCGDSCGDDDGSYRTHTRGDKHGIKHGVTHGSEPLDQDGERAATRDSTDDLLDGVGDGSATVFGMATPVSPTVAI